MNRSFLVFLFFNIDINNLTSQCYNAKNDVTLEKIKNSEKIVELKFYGVTAIGDPKKFCVKANKYFQSDETQSEYS